MRDVFIIKLRMHGRARGECGLGLELGLEVQASHGPDPDPNPNSTSRYRQPYFHIRYAVPRALPAPGEPSTSSTTRSSWHRRDSTCRGAQG